MIIDNYTKLKINSELYRRGSGDGFGYGDKQKKQMKMKTFSYATIFYAYRLGAGRNPSFCHCRIVYATRQFLESRSRIRPSASTNLFLRGFDRKFTKRSYRRSRLTEISSCTYRSEISGAENWCTTGE